VVKELLCPQCEKVSFTAAEEVYSPCPYCSFIFSGRHGSDKREIPRIETKEKFTLQINSRKYPANTVNISETGVCIQADKKVPLTSSKFLSLTIPYLNLKTRAKIVWIDKSGQTYLAGLKMIHTFKSLSI
jgi:hypothetical protein